MPTTSTRLLQTRTRDRPPSEPGPKPSLRYPGGKRRLVPYVAAALNGDVDNYAELRDGAGLHIPPEVTRTTKAVVRLRRLLEPRSVLRRTGPDEGWEVAEALNARGIAAFVLKYRLQPTPDSLDEFPI